MHSRGHTSSPYFVTICTHNRRILFGDIADGEMHLNELGRIVADCWFDLISHYPHVELDEFIVMPNHLHGIIILTDVVEAGLKPASTGAGKRHGLSEIVRALKTFSSRRISQLRNTPGRPVWQRNYYEHVIRKEADFDAIRHYVRYNAAKWPEDRYNPVNTKSVLWRRDILKA